MPISNEPAIEIKDLWKSFRIYHERHQTLKETILARRRAAFEEIWAVQDMNISVAHGETLGIIGRNGSGKSTLLKLVGRILEPTKGSITTNGRIATLIELGAGFEPNLTGRENVFLNGSILGLTKAQVVEKFDSIVAFAELAKFIDTPVKNYSSGMYMRLGFSVAVHTEPDILLLDEGLSVGDEAFQRKCLDKVDEFRDAGKTILFVTHDAAAARRICNRVVMLENGEVVSEGNPDDVIQDYHDELAPDESEREWGTRQLEIENLELLDADGAECDEYIAGKYMKIRFHFKVNTPVDEPVFGIGIYDTEGNRVAGTNSLLRGCSVGTPKGPGFFEFEIDKIPMLNGRFSVSPAITSPDNQKVYHWQESKYYFSVKSVIAEVGSHYLSGSCRVVLDSGQVFKQS